MPGLYLGHCFINIELSHWNNFISQTSKKLMFKDIALDDLIKQHECRGYWWLCGSSWPWFSVCFSWFALMSTLILEFSKASKPYNHIGLEKARQMQENKIKLPKSEEQHWLQEPKQTESKDPVHTWCPDHFLGSPGLRLPSWHRPTPVAAGRSCSGCFLSPC